MICRYLGAYRLNFSCFIPVFSKSFVCKLRPTTNLVLVSHIRHIRHTLSMAGMFIASLALVSFTAVVWARPNLVWQTLFLARHAILPPNATTCDQLCISGIGSDRALKVGHLVGL